jgi:acetyl-CoA synthetase
MKDCKKYFPPREFQKKAAIKSFRQYKEIYKHSINDPRDFWAERAMELHWFKKWENVLEYDFTEAYVKWFEGGKINVSYNCLDRHLYSWRKNKAALIWIGENSNESKIYTYQMLHTEVSRFANVLRKNGITVLFSEVLVRNL